MNFFNFKNKFFLDMSKLEITLQSVVFVDKVFSSFKPKSNQINQIKIQNPFEKVANPLALKGVFKKPVVPIQFNDNFHKEFIAGDYTVIYDLLPPRLEISNKNPNPKEIDAVRSVALEIVNYSEIEKEIGAVGVNYEMFLEGAEIDLRKYLLKDEVAEGFTSLSATPIFKLPNESTTLNLKIASATNDSNKEGIFFGVNFHALIEENVTIADILAKDFYSIATDKIKLVFSKLITE